MRRDRECVPTSSITVKQKQLVLENTDEGSIRQSERGKRERITTSKMKRKRKRDLGYIQQQE
jgi:hypothetical protein